MWEESKKKQQRVAIDAGRRSIADLRVCHSNGARLIFCSSPPFGLSSRELQPLLALGIRTVVDLRADWERQDSGDEPIYRHFQLMEWPATVSPTAADSRRLLLRLDAFKCDRRHLLRFLRDAELPDGLRSGHLTPFLQDAEAAKSYQRRLLDFVECFKPALAAVFAVIADSANHPMLLTCGDGRTKSGAVCAILQLLLKEEPSLVAQEFAKTALMQSSSGESCRSDQTEEFAAMTTAIEHLTRKYRSVENFLLSTGLSEEQIRQLKTATTASTSSTVPRVTTVSSGGNVSIVSS